MTGDIEFKDAMRYCEMYLAEKGERRVLKTPDDLRKLFEELDAARSTDGNAHFSENFYKAVISDGEGVYKANTDAAVSALGGLDEKGGYRGLVFPTATPRYVRGVERNRFLGFTKMGGGIGRWRSRRYLHRVTPEQRTTFRVSHSRLTMRDSERLEYWKRQGRTTLPYEYQDRNRAGYAVLSPFKTKKGTVVQAWNDIRTGQRVSGKTVYEE